MREIVQRPLARTDLLKIWRYSFERWGEAQASDYLRHLNQRIRQLALNPRHGYPLEDVAGEFRSLLVGRHLIVYRFTDRVLVVERILHQRMHVGESF
ncbi:MAG: type II toxin-antitoxin system RelE/ParE family toxin [Rhodobacteraceae bacterium]|nr:type II toxin-antitoxin system RelE/ParE family toxin [Paracoccaceae bacterium]